MISFFKKKSPQHTGVRELNPHKNGNVAEQSMAEAKIIANNIMYYISNKNL